MDIFHHELSRDAPSLLSPVVQVSASRGQEQAGRCMGWKDRSTTEISKGCKFGRIILLKYDFRLITTTYSFSFLYSRVVVTSVCTCAKMGNSRIQNTHIKINQNRKIKKVIHAIIMQTGSRYQTLACT